MFILTDLKNTINFANRALLVCWLDVAARHRRTILGPFWPIIAVTLGSVGIALLWGLIFKMDFQKSIPLISTGFIVWYFISGTIVEAKDTFVGQASAMQNLRLPIGFFPLIVVLRNGIIFVQTLVVILLLNLVFPPDNITKLPLFLPNFLATILNLFLMVYLIGFISARYRDLGMLITSIMPLLFFISPVVFKVDMLSPSFTWILLLNPLSVFVMSIRDPIVGIESPDHLHTVQGLLFLIQAVLLAYFLEKKNTRLVYWI